MSEYHKLGGFVQADKALVSSLGHLAGHLLVSLLLLRLLWKLHVI